MSLKPFADQVYPEGMVKQYGVGSIPILPQILCPTGTTCSSHVFGAAGGGGGGGVQLASVPPLLQLYPQFAPAP